MKNIYHLLIAALLTISTVAKAQQITYSGEDVTLKTVFSVIQKQTGYGFFYSKSLLKTALPVSINAKNTPIREVLAAVFKNQPLTYAIENKTILVSKKNNQDKVVASAQAIKAELPSATKEKQDKEQPKPDPIEFSKMTTVDDTKNESSFASSQVSISSINLKGSNSSAISDHVQSHSDQLMSTIFKAIRTNKKALYAEFSFLETTHLTGNFDVRLKPDRNDGFGFRAGMGTDLQHLILPFGVNYLAGKNKGSFEAGIGAIPRIAVDFYSDGGFNDGYLTVGYRYQAMQNGLLLRANWTKFTSLFDNYGSYKPMLSFSVGYSFNSLRGIFATDQPQKNHSFAEGHRKSVFVEFAGHGMGISGNYDVRLKPDRNDGFGVRGGLGIIANYLTLPLNINYIVGKKRSGFEMGLGITTMAKFMDEQDGIVMMDESVGNLSTAAMFNFGYRLQSNNGFQFRINNSAIYWNDEFSVIWPGLSVGYSLSMGRNSSANN